MGHVDQCPSKGAYEQKPRKVAPEHTGVGPTGQAYWRSLDDLADTPEFRDWLEREFPAGASELLDDSRRTFLKIMGAGLALAGAATLPGCRRPDHKILPYSREVPEEVIPGKPLYYATSLAYGGAGGTVEGLLVETHENRPTKTEGNPLHPINRGRSSVWGQASVLGVYDPDRLKDPIFTNVDGAPRSWEDFAAWSAQHFSAYDDKRGQGLAFIVDKRRSPTLRAMRDRIMRRWPEAAWVWYDATQMDAPIRGSEIALGAPHHELLHLEHAKVIVSLDRDFLHGGCEGRGLVNAREFAATRRMLTTADADRMSRLYVVESHFTPTGGKADHRMALSPSQVTTFAAALYARVMGMTGKGSAQAPSVPAAWEKWLTAIAGDLESNPGAGLIVAGPSQPPEVHAMVAAMNAAIGAVGKTVSYVPMDEVDAASSADALAALTEKMRSGAITTLVTINANPVFNAPAALRFAEAFKNVPMRITLAADPNETVGDPADLRGGSNWRLPAAHELESWGDTLTIDGVLAPTQPMIAPLYGGKSDIETLAIIVEGDLARADGYQLVRETWQTTLGLGGADFERRWRRALHDGVVAGEAPAPRAPSVRFDAVASAAASLRIPGAPTAQSLEVVFVPTHMGDGRWANNAWLQELPDPTTRIVWDNAALVSPATARALGMMQDKETAKERGAVVATLTVGGREMDIAVWATPGIADNTVVLPMGWGREVCGRVGMETGFNVFKVRAGAEGAASGATLAPSTRERRRYPISTTQTHGSVEGRAIIREIDVQAWKKHGDEPPVTEQDSYGRSKTLNFAERLDGAEMTHMPANISIYKNPFNDSYADAAKGSTYSKGPQWGMSIDLATCTGCGVCTIACNAENNIPMVGKIEVNKGREMHWIRVDRYFTGADADHVDSMVYQPMPCVHCENAPCETVCPVNATVHGPEGINYMAYNRCIGTRYCANNCPYKVRRFNFFDFGPAKFNGHYAGEKVLGGVVKNPNLVPPRLRERLDEISRAQKNPDVTIRSRGVMEKCSLCIQRINEARIEAKLSDLTVKGPDGKIAPIPDGLVQTACQQACPTDSIVFGDILDEASNDGRGSRIRYMRNHARTYAVLGYLNTRPRTTHMIGVRNPNPLLRQPVENPFGHHGSGHGADHGHDHDHGAPGHSDAHGSHSMLPLTAPAERGVKVRLPVLGGIA